MRASTAVVLELSTNVYEVSLQVVWLAKILEAAHIFVDLLPLSFSIVYNNSRHS